MNCINDKCKTCKYLKTYENGVPYCSLIWEVGIEKFKCIKETV